MCAGLRALFLSLHRCPLTHTGRSPLLSVDRRNGNAYGEHISVAVPSRVQVKRWVSGLLWPALGLLVPSASASARRHAKPKHNTTILGRVVSPCPPRSTALPGINDGVATMREGGRRLLYLPPHLGYGRFSSPPNVTLIVEAELLQVGEARTFLHRLRKLFA